jgi:hypothetical protein
MNAEWDAFAQEWEARLEERLQRLGTRAPRCAGTGCDETFPFALTGVHPAIYCYECQAVRAGRPWLEDHHVAGRNADATTGSTPRNDHRVLSELQQLWPRETLRNPEGSPLLKAAASLRGWLDLLWLIITRTVGWIPAFLEQLDAWLRQRLGPRWWDELDG